MSNKLTYRQAYDKIIEAYFRNEIDPMDSKFCFCGTLCGNTRTWHYITRTAHKDSHGYVGSEFVEMEMALLDTLNRFGFFWYDGRLS